jgi:hypothetical protein
VIPFFSLQIFNFSNGEIKDIAAEVGKVKVAINRKYLFHCVKISSPPLM